MVKNSEKIPIQKKISNEKGKQDDILSIVQQFVSYFEKLDRGEKDDNSISNS